MLLPPGPYQFLISRVFPLRIVTMHDENPKKIYIFSGKRKSGKDFFTDLLFKRIDPETSVIIRLSAPIKSHWAKLNNLDYDQLLDASEYKESHRVKMVEWSEKVRKEDHGYFCRAAIDISKANDKPIWIITDARRITDIQWFKENYGNIVSIYKIYADELTRKSRGWKFTEGIDDMETECGLDNFTEWTAVITNTGSSQDLEPIIFKMAQDISDCLDSVNV